LPTWLLELRRTSARQSPTK